MISDSLRQLSAQVLAGNILPHELASTLAVLATQASQMERVCQDARNTGSLAGEALSNHIPVADRMVACRRIRETVAAYYQVSSGELGKRRRPTSIVWPRHVAMFLTREMTRESMQRIGDYYGGRDHGTVFYACRNVMNALSISESAQKEVQELRSQLALFGIIPKMLTSCSQHGNSLFTSPEEAELLTPGHKV